MADGKNFTEWSAENGDTKTFSPAGHIRSVQYFKKGTELSSTSKYSYVPANNTYEAKGYWPDGRVISSSAYKTDDKGNILEEAQIDSAGIMSRKYKYTYDIKNRILFREGHTADGKLTSKTSYTYDAAGNRTDKTEMPRYATSYQTYKYDGNGNVAVEERLGCRPAQL